MPIPLVRLNAQISRTMPAAQWSSPGDEPVLAHNGGQKRPKGHLEESTTSGRLWKRHSCLHFKCRALALDGSNFHSSIVSPRLMNNCAAGRDSTLPGYCSA